MKQALVEKLKLLPKFGSGICLARMTTALRDLQLESYLHNTPKVAITGTNGKGSVAKLLNEILSQMGFNGGLFTSPHFVEFNERFRLANRDLPYDMLNEIFDEIYPKINELESALQESFGVFEVLFLLALTSFKKCQADFLVFEAGIGGRYDPVRLLNADLTALTSVDMEHSEILGNSKELIAYDKLDACQSGGTTVIGNIDQQLKAKIDTYCRLRNTQAVYNSAIDICASDEGELAVTIRKDSHFQCHSALFGKFAMENIKTTLCLAEIILDKYPLKQRLMAYEQAIQFHVNPGRLSKISDSPRVFVDSAHTAEAYRLLFDSLAQRYQNNKPIFLIGISEGRDTSPLTKGIKSLAHYCIVSSATQKGASPALLCDELKSVDVACQVEYNLPHAVSEALKMATSQSKDLIVCGGLFFAGEVTAIIKGSTGREIFLF